RSGGRAESRVDAPTPPFRRAPPAGAGEQGARNIPPGSAAPEETARRPDKPEPAAASTPAPTEPDVALLQPSTEPPPATVREFGSSSPSPTLERGPEMSLPPVKEASPITGRDLARTAPPATPASPNLQQKAQAPLPQQPIREAKPKRASLQQADQAIDHTARNAALPVTKATQDYSSGRARQDYLWKIVRKLSQQRFYRPSGQSERGLVVVRLVVERGGRLLDVSLTRSSGSGDLDRAVINAVRDASPFGPLPAELAGDDYAFVVPINYTQEH